ncbi:subtilisin BL [Trichoderma asperellum]|uniref:Subtilisin BL n=1 Tax=Trichoderma asperellum TaxID=101201 RepID=A0A6V8R627_TRIAP|nr:subtilisin BL [Trichoderma asperellum]
MKYTIIDFSILKIAQRGLLGSLDLINFWTHDDDGTNTPVVQQTNWKKLITRGKNGKLEQPRSLGGPQVLSERKVSSDEWFDKIDRLKAVMELPASAKGTYNSVKICVIDTGFKLGVKGFTKIKVYKDFVNPGSTSMCDNTWHGTISASIIMSIYEKCELYVARAFNSDDTDDKTEPELMAQAIEWAITPDIDVDIISISAGFLYHSPRLQDAVQKASAANKLVFAAASNWGNLGPVAFPARHNLYTICVFSTDTHNRASHFNPERRPDAHNFAILGEDFQHPGDANQRVRGTSTATAAAAGLAALIIDFTRHQDNCQSIFRVADVSKMLGMIAIFNAISERAGEFKCIMPLKLLPSDFAGMSLQQMREYIRESLSRAMDQAN